MEGDIMIGFRRRVVKATEVVTVASVECSSGRDTTVADMEEVTAVVVEEEVLGTITAMVMVKELGEAHGPKFLEASLVDMVTMLLRLLVAMVMATTPGATIRTVPPTADRLDTLELLT